MANDDGGNKESQGDGYSFSRRRDDRVFSFEEIQAIARGVARVEIDTFSKDTLGWNYLDPKERGEHQRTPEEILAYVTSRRSLREGFQKRVGAAVMLIVTVAFTSFMSAEWPVISTWLWSHL